MSKTQSLYVCQQCGNEESKWHGKCPTCGEWGSLVEAPKPISYKSGSKRAQSAGKPAATIPLTSVKTKKSSRVSTKISELDRVLGGGIVSGQVILIAGEPGIGKSTLLMQAANTLGTAKNLILYVSGEESSYQLKLRADRLGINNKNINLSEETNIDEVVNTISTFKGVVVDSIQTMQTDDLSGMAGSVGQVRECAHRLVKVAKRLGVPIFIVGHVTKQGSVAGPAVLMHIVDTVLWFEGEKISKLRMLRAVKNRFGSTDEVGIFEMGEKGLLSLADPKKMFITGIRKKISGSVIGVVMQGNRPILVEVQALVNSTKLAFPRRTAQGIDSKRFELLLAILERRCGLGLSNFDSYVKVSGGLKAHDPSLDLAICLAVASAYFDKPLKQTIVAIGEVGLLGEIKDVAMHERMLKETKRLGFANTINSVNSKYLGEVIKSYLR